MEPQLWIKCLKLLQGGINGALDIDAGSFNVGPVTPIVPTHPNRMALHWTIGSALFSALGAGLLGLAHTWPAVNKWTHGTLITPMHGHMAFFGAYVMIVLGMITYALPGLTGRGEDSRETSANFWSFWLQISGMFGMLREVHCGGQRVVAGP